MDKTNLKQASVFYLVGNLFNKGIAFLTVPIFTRILSTADYGVINTYNSWIGIVSMVIGFALHMAIRSSFVDYGDKVDDFLSVITSFTLLCGGSIIAAVSVVMIFSRCDSRIVLVLLCVIQGLSTALIQNYSMYLMMRYEYKYRTALMILPNMISAGVSIVVIKWFIKENAYMGRIVPTVLITTFFGILVLTSTYKKSRAKIKWDYVSYGLKISTPLILHGIALNILSQSDRTMITLLADSSQTGIYSLVHNFGLIATVLTTSLEGIWVPWFTDRLKERKINEINGAAKDYLILMTVAMISVVMVGPEVIKIMAPEKYWVGIQIIPMVVLANYFIFVYSFYVNIEHFYKKTVYISKNTLIAAGMNLMLNFILIPIWGYVGAAVTTLVSYIVSFFMHANYSKKLEPELFPLRSFSGPLLQILICTIVFYLTKDEFIIRWVVCIGYIAVSAFRYKEKVFEILNTRFKKKIE